jgi:signal transduction histidine kinase/uncharacterized membrane protein YgdD (TMEM256/DUF423 family)
MMLQLALNQTIFFAIALVILGVGTYVLVQNHRNPIHISFWIFASGIAIWVGGFAFLSLTASQLADKIVHYGALIMLSGFLWFSHVFPQGARLPRPSWLLLLPIALTAVFVVPANLLVEDIIQHPDGRIEPVIGPLLGWYALGFLCYVVWGFVNFWRTYRDASEHARLQMKYLVLGIGLLFSCILVGDLFLPALFSITELNLIGPLSSIAFVLLTAYAIIRHQLMDIRIVIQRGLIYSVLLSLIIGAYLALVASLRLILPDTGDAAGLIASIGTIALGIFGAPHIEHVFRKATDRIFFKDRYRYADALRTLSEVLHTNIELTDLVCESEAALTHILRATSVQVVLGPEEHEGAALVMPLTLDGATIGCIVLGRKRSGDPYTSEDRQLLETFAYQAATALSRARLYADAQRHATELKEKVTERTRELSRAYERERQMINDISHNLQTPLTILQTRLERMKGLSQDQGEIRSLEQSLTSFSRFIYELLSLAQLEGRTRSKLVPVDLSALVQDLSEEVSTIASAKSVRVSAAVHPDIRVKGDAGRLREAFMNIASNALTYLRPEGGTVAISMAASATNAFLTVIDTGIGIPAEDLPYIFDRFYRGKHTATKPAGTGLGLAIAKRIIEQHKGTIAAQSVEGEGATITISLPLHQD